ncbi:MAG: hypothetical protein OHK93_007454 [Ramalina farinacea]|uniref:DNA mismatch repair protein S5 domain-containing protein n=1 Tax=Ramalina farinacea TaxID=258253 RepID=A0AA43QPR4_9LECA|nr:hypothetical protein [Ramalina farinacea]
MNLKVLKTKKDAQDFTYAPKHAHLGSQPDLPSMEDAAIKIFGVKISEHYNHVNWNSSNSLESQRSADTNINLSQSLNEQGYVFEGYLPKAESTFDCSHIAPPRQFFSIDSRPLSGKRGTMKQITSIFKKYFKSVPTSVVKGQKVDPIICLNIICPRGSYDANIEPAKDDVLFTSPGTVLDSAEAFFKSVYGDLPIADQPVNAKRTDPDVSLQDLMLAQKPERLSNSDSEHLTQTSLVSPHAESTSIRSGLESSVPGANRIRESSQDEDNPENDISISNPWAFAKLNSKMGRTKPRRSVHAGHDEDIQLPTPEQEQPQRHLTPARTRPIRDGLLSPDQSSPSPFPYPLSARPKSHENDERVSRPRNDDPTQGKQVIGCLDHYMKSSHSQNLEKTGLLLDATTDLDEAESRTEHAEGFRTAAALPQGTALSNIPDISELPQGKRSARRQSKSLHKPFTPPVNDLQDVWFKTGNQSHKKQSQNCGANNTTGYSTTNIPSLNLRDDEKLEPAPSPSRSRSSSPTHPDLALSMDYETRKARATADYRLAQKLQRREALQQQKRQAAAAGPPSPTSVLSPRISLPHSKPSPHLNRQRNAIAALRSLIPQPSALDPYDPRACLIRHQQAQAEGPGNGGNRSRRPRTAQLPLETVKAEDALQDLVLALSISISDLEREVQRNPDAADGNGDEGSAFEMCGDEDVQYWQEIVEGLTRQFHDQKGGSGRLDVDVAEGIGKAMSLGHI